MARMKSSWDEDTQENFLEELIDEEFPDSAQFCDRQPFPEVNRQPDLQLPDKAGEISEYVYLLQPAEVSKSLFDELESDDLEQIRFYVPYDSIDEVSEWLEDRVEDGSVTGFRINCGQLQILDQ
jgi:hypothetical protein